MRDKRFGGRTAVKQARPKRMTEIKRLFKSRQRGIESQASQLILKFLGEHPEIDTTLAITEGLWSFLKFLKSSGFYIIDKEEVFCFPLGKMVKLSRLGKAGGRDGE